MEDVTNEQANKAPPETYREELFGDAAALPDRPTNGRELLTKLVKEFPIVERIEQLERIDVVVDRTIKRLMQIKTMKQMHRQLEPKQVESRVIAPPKNKKGRVSG